MPLVLMTGFGYDPGHSIVKARQAGAASRALQAVPPGPIARHGRTSGRTAPAGAPAELSNVVHYTCVHVKQARTPALQHTSLAASALHPAKLFLSRLAPAFSCSRST